MEVNYFRKKWNYFADIALWIFTVAGTFLVSPPLLNINNSYPVESFTRFVVAGLLALMYIPVRKFSKNIHYRIWYKAAKISFFISIISTLLYYVLIYNWSVNYYGKSLVIGRNMFEEAAKSKIDLGIKLNKPIPVDNETFVKARGGETQYIWPKSELENRFFVLLILYIICVISIGSLLTTIIQSIFCYEIGIGSA